MVGTIDGPGGCTSLRESGLDISAKRTKRPFGPAGVKSRQSSFPLLAKGRTKGVERRAGPNQPAEHKHAPAARRTYKRAAPALMFHSGLAPLISFAEERRGHRA